MDFPGMPTEIARFMWPTWGPPGVAGLHAGPMNIIIGVHSDSQLSASTETEGSDQQYLKWMGDIDKGKKQGGISVHLIFDIFLNCLFYFVKQGNRYNYADDNSLSAIKLTALSRQLQAKAEVTVQWFLNNAIEVNPTKFQGLLLRGNQQTRKFSVFRLWHKYDIESFRKYSLKALVPLFSKLDISVLNTVYMFKTRMTCTLTLTLLHISYHLFDYLFILYFIFIHAHFSFVQMIY